MFDSESGTINGVLRQVEEAADSARSQEELVKAVDIACQYPGSLYPNKTVPIILIICGALVAAIALLGPDGKPSDKAIIVSMLALTASFIGVAMLIQQSSQSSDISYKIAQLSSYFSNSLAVFDGTSSSNLLDLRNKFRDYRGNQGELCLSLAGEYHGEIHELTYKLYKLKYYKSSLDARDDKAQEKYRYSLIIDFPWVKNIYVRSGSVGEATYPITWETSSPDFNEKFTLSGSSEIECAKFAKPASLQHISLLGTEFENLNLEFSSSGTLCVSLDNDILQFKDIGITILARHLFISKIKEGIELPQLQRLLSMAHKLAEYYDDNFEVPSTPRSP